MTILEIKKAIKKELENGWTPLEESFNYPEAIIAKFFELNKQLPDRVTRHFKQNLEGPNPENITKEPENDYSNPVKGFS